MYIQYKSPIRRIISFIGIVQYNNNTQNNIIFYCVYTIETVDNRLISFILSVAYLLSVCYDALVLTTEDWNMFNDLGKALLACLFIALSVGITTGVALMVLIWKELNSVVVY